ncbi:MULTISPECIES: DUF3392 domain-containing protein [unclassified Shewanella]|uniref:DUF3392 domain-containing protein n=1 Tax=unclassified Shewanella TaxID=196818 RepID=UPI001C81F4D8|nr:MULTISPECIES: DUF3392 domain-containing protein [unclassified Shewanella]MCG9728582.1 DUF3392 domain-containing protein [Shewanella sp. Isolate13]
MSNLISKAIEFFNYLGSFIYPWLAEVSTAIIACCLVVFGADINRFLRRYLAGRSFLLRTLIFVIVNAFGYGLIIIHLSPVLAQNMAKIPSHWLFLLVVAIFFAIGSWAQRNRQV